MFQFHAYRPGRTILYPNNRGIIVYTRVSKLSSLMFLRLGIVQHGRLLLISRADWSYRFFDERVQGRPSVNREEFQV